MSLPSYCYIIYRRNEMEEQNFVFLNRRARNLQKKCLSAPQALHWKTGNHQGWHFAALEHFYRLYIWGPHALVLYWYKHARFLMQTVKKNLFYRVGSDKTIVQCLWRQPPQDQTRVLSYPFLALLFQSQAIRSLFLFKSRNKLLLLHFIWLSLPSEFIK